MRFQIVFMQSAIFNLQSAMKLGGTTKQSFVPIWDEGFLLAFALMKFDDQDRQLESRH